jgi:uncharacterized protein YbjT (DUF2867 family)
MAADDVASALADVTVGPPVKGIIEIAGPQQFHLDDLVRNTLRERQTPARSSPTPTRPTTVPNCTNAPSSPAVGARLAKTRFDQWQNQSTIGNS